MRYFFTGIALFTGVLFLSSSGAVYSYLTYRGSITSGASELQGLNSSDYAHDGTFELKNIYNQGLLLAKEGKYDEARNIFSSVLKEDIPSNILSSTLEILGDIAALEGEKQDIEKQLLLLSGALKQYEGSLAIAQNKRIEQKINLIRTIYEKNETSSRLREGNPLPSDGGQGKTSKRPPSKQEIETIGETRRTLGIYESEKNKYLEYTQDSEKVSAEEILWRSLDTTTTSPGQEDW